MERKPRGDKPSFGEKRSFAPRTTERRAPRPANLAPRRVALETLLADDLARKPKHQKPQLQAQWRKEIEEIEAQL